MEGIGEDTVIDFIKGDERAFAKIYNHLKGRMFSVSIKYTKCPAESEDVVSMAFVKLWEDREKIINGDHLQHWLYKRVYTRSLNAVRDTKCTDDLDEKHEQAPCDPYSFELDMIRAEVVERIYNAVSCLPKVQKRVFEMNLFSHLSYKEIGDMLKISTQTVRNNFAKARHNILLQVNK